MHCFYPVTAQLVSFINPGVSGLCVVAEIFLSEPETNLVVGGVHRVRAVADVPSNLQLNINY